MDKTINMRVSNTDQLTGKPLPGYKILGIDPYICFYKVKDNNKSDSGYEAIIHVKIDQAITATDKNTKNMNLPVIQSLDHQGPRFVRMLTVILYSIRTNLGP